MSGSTAAGSSPRQTVSSSIPSASVKSSPSCTRRRPAADPLHGLRHNYASIALAKGVNPAIVSRRLGHSTVAFTLEVYSHVLPQVDAEAAELIAAYDAV